MLFAITLSMFAALPPITSVPQALSQLRSAQKIEALANLKEACRGKYRRELRDKEELKTQLEAIFTTAKLEEKKAALDAHVCFSNKQFAPLVEQAIRSDDPALITYGAEVAARLEDPSFVAVLHEVMEPRRAACMKAIGDQVCVWLTYAPSALLASADDATKQKAAALAKEMSGAADPKIKEVAAEVLKAAKSGRGSK